MRTSRMFWAMVVAGACIVALAATPSWAQPGGRGGQGRGNQGGFGGGFGGGGLSQILMNESVQKELELLDDQIDDLTKMGEGQRDKVREAFSGMQDLSREERGAKFREIMEKVQADQEKEIGKILLPHQMKRAKQLQFQMRTRGGIGGAVRNDELAEQLGITEAQREKLQEKAQELEEEIREELTELREKAQKELLGILTPAQQAKWKELAGDAFEMQRPERPQGAQAGQRGQRGNQTGERGRRGG